MVLIICYHFPYFQFSMYLTFPSPHTLPASLAVETDAAVKGTGTSEIQVEFEPSF